jgi:hypothetical protein
MARSQQQYHGPDHRSKPLRRHHDLRRQGPGYLVSADYRDPASGRSIQYLIVLVDDLGFGASSAFGGSGKGERPAGPGGRATPLAGRGHPRSLTNLRLPRASAIVPGSPISPAGLDGSCRPDFVPASAPARRSAWPIVGQNRPLSAVQPRLCIVIVWADGRWFE